MNTYVAVLNYAIPFFVGLIFLEIIAASILKKNVIRSMDTLASLSSGLTNVIKDVLGLTLIIVSYRWMVGHMALIHIKATWIVYIIGFIGLDFAGYWVHRLSHEINYLWNHHIVHHSSEEFNLGCALRQSISSWFSINFIFMVPLAVLGIPADVIAIISPLHLFAQYWYHTRLIGNLGFLEKIIVTPSHHRVHHAINKEYLDKNHAQIFIVWDKLFGTFQKELPDVIPIYGVKRPIRSWNPFIINFIHLWQLILDAWRTSSWKDKILIWIKPTGWRPSDVVENYPIETIDDVYSHSKYNPTYGTLFHLWSWIQFIMTFALMMYLFNRLNDISFSHALMYGGFLYLSIFSYTMLMDQDKRAVWAEWIKTAAGIMILFVTNDWFLLSEWWAIGPNVVLTYLLISGVVVSFFSIRLLPGLHSISSSY